MCGLVFVGGRSSLSAGDINLFENMLWCDTFRGDHSTGVAAWYKPWNEDGFVKTVKMAVDGADFVKTKAWQEVKTVKTQSASGVEITTWPKAIFGHNRFATMGAVNAVNAHPFRHGHIILAHNGTLRNRTNLPEHQRFEVDSENICYSISQIGAEETIKRLVGAFTLIWIDTQEQTLNIIRNDERPFHLFETSFGDWFGCSEEKMGDWILTRERVPRRIKRHFEAEPGTQYVFDLSKGSCDFKEEIKRELAPFQSTWPTRSTYNSRWSDDYEDDYDAWWNDRIDHNRSVSKTTPKATEEKSTAPTNETYRASVKSLLNKYGLENQIGDKIEIQMYEFYEYPKRPGFGRITGWVPAASDFMEVQVHDISAEEFEVDGFGIVEICSAYEVNYVPTIIGKPNNNRFFKKEVEVSDDLDFLESIAEREPVFRTTLSGERFDETEWKKSVHNSCAMCGDAIDFEDLEYATIENGYCFCGICIQQTEEEAKKIEEESRPKVTGGSYCSACAMYHTYSTIEGDISEEKWSRLSDACEYKKKHAHKFVKAPSNVIALPAPVKKEASEESRKPFRQEDSSGSSEGTAFKVIPVGNGMRINKMLWEQMNGCRECGKAIPWGLAEHVEFWGHAPVCPDCSDTLDAAGNR